MIISFSVPGAPRGWARARLAKGGAHHFTDAKTAAFKDSVAFWATEALKARDAAGMMKGPVSVTIKSYFPIAASLSAKKRNALDHAPATRRPDADNLAKAVLDALNGVLYADDVQVTTLIVHKIFHEEPSTWVQVISSDIQEML